MRFGPSGREIGLRISHGIPATTARCLRSLRLFLGLLLRFAVSRQNLLLENIALRQQLAVLRTRHPQPRFRAADRLFWVVLRRLWPSWRQALILIQPETVIRWHRAGFEKYWTMIGHISAWRSRHRQAELLRKIPRRVPRLFQCRGSVVCITDTISPPKRALPTYFMVYDELQSKRRALLYRYATSHRVCYGLTVAKQPSLQKPIGHIRRSTVSASIILTSDRVMARHRPNQWVRADIPSNARFSCSTLTRGSPRMPNWRE